MPKRTLTSLAALALLTGCSSDSSAPASPTTPTASTPATQQPGTVTPLPTPATPPAATTAPHRVETSFFGVLGDQINETRDFVTRLWVMQWSWGGDIATQLAEIAAARVPATFDLDRVLYPPGATTLYHDAEQRLRDLAAQMVASGADEFIDSVHPCDEPNLKELKRSDSIPAATELVRRVFQNKRWRCNFSGAYTWDHMDLFDDVGCDHLRLVDKVVAASTDFDSNVTPPIADTWLAQMRPDQGLLLVPGGSEMDYAAPNIQLWIDYAKKVAATGRNVEVCGFAWRVPEGAIGMHDPMVGICDQPALRAQYEAAFKGKA